VGSVAQKPSEHMLFASSATGMDVEKIAEIAEIVQNTVLDALVS